MTENIAYFEDLEIADQNLYARAYIFSNFLREWEKTPQYHYSTTRYQSMGTQIHLQKEKSRPFLVMASNDYLGLSSHPKVRTAAKKAIDVYGVGSTGSPLATGMTGLQEELVLVLATLFQKEAAMLFNSGFSANLGAIPAIACKNDLIIADKLCHRSIQEGILASQARTYYFKHNNIEELEALLHQHRPSYAGALVVTEGLFSTNGVVPPIDQITSIAHRYNARVYLDEAHSFGTIGPSGLGCFELSRQPPDIIMGTFSKMCGGLGGFIAADAALIDWLRFYAKTYIFSAALPPASIASTLAAIQVFQEEPHLLITLRRNIQYFCEGLRHLGFAIPDTHHTPIVPLVIGDEAQLGHMNACFLKEGLYVTPLIYPVVAKSQCQFRFAIMSTHTFHDLDFALETIQKSLS